MGLIPKAPITRLPVFEASTVLLYAAPKVGKTTFLAQSGALILSTDRGLAGHTALGVDCDTWQTLLNVTEEIRRTRPKHFRWIAIDTLDYAYELCRAAVLARLAPQRGPAPTHESDVPHGKGWALVRQEWQTWIRALRSLGYGILWTSHATTQTVQVGRNKSYERQVPAFGSGKVSEWTAGEADLVLFAEVLDDGRRVIHSRPTQYRRAGDRFGVLPAELPLEWAALEEAFRGATEDEPAPPPPVDEPPDFMSLVREAARRQDLTREDLEAFCQRWRRVSLAELQEVDRRILLERVLTGTRIATALQSSEVEALREREGERFAELYRAAGGAGQYRPEHLMSAVAERLLAPAPVPERAKAPLPEDIKQDVRDIEQAYSGAGLEQRWWRLCGEHIGGVTVLPHITEAQARRLLDAAHKDWADMSAAQAAGAVR